MMKRKQLNDSAKRITALEMLGTFGEVITDTEIQNFYESLDGLAEAQKAGLAKARLAVNALPRETGVEADELIEALELLRDARMDHHTPYRPTVNLRPSY